MKRLTILFTLVILTAMLSACGAEAPGTAEEGTPMPTVMADTAIIAEGRLEPAQYADISFSSGGIVGEVFFAEGDEVTEDDILAQLDNVDLLETDVKNAQDEVERAEADILTEVAEAYEALRVAQQRLDNYSIPTDFDGMTPEEAAAEMKTIVDKARADYDPYFGYDNPRGYVKILADALEDAWADYNQALEWMSREADLESAKVRLAQAQADHENLLSGEDIAAQRNLSTAESALADAELRTPIGGTVASLDVKEGESVAMGQASATVADFSNWQVVTTDLTELDVVKVSEGQKVTITLDAMPESPLTGTVLSIGQTFAESQGDVVYEVTISLDETHPNMRWGMTALVEFVE
ncbi:MAG: HlyD family efflux transporter periplasmic adaptor subunit [Anaerolineae bacterium]|jgi:HlyD family secretion protein|nr:HlyD family efflux transporter periplasmic adaptor subunit [Anaerolineae bacterium]MBT7990017.1 HlyD family efflux transporter periplasmic adaptor subunit [Anaerolineae bacterium]